MPCRSDYLEQTHEEANNQLAAQLLVYVYEALRQDVPDWVAAEAKTYYAHDTRSVPLLCKTVKGLTPRQLKRIVYDGTNPTARKLADWWDKHQQMDEEKVRRARRATADKRLRESALSKLTAAEKRALGVS